MTITNVHLIHVTTGLVHLVLKVTIFLVLFFAPLVTSLQTKKVFDDGMHNVAVLHS